jgi:hypothetical protein
MAKPIPRWPAAGLLAVHGAAFLTAFVYGWTHLDAFARLTYHAWPPCSPIDSCDPAWGTSQLAWFVGFLLVGLMGQLLLLTAAGVWLRSGWSGLALTLLSAAQLLLALRLLSIGLWWLGLLLVPLPALEVILLRLTDMPLMRQRRKTGRA